MSKSPNYKTFEAGFPSIGKGQSYAEYCQLYFGNTAYMNIGKKLTGKSGQELLDEASPSLRAAWLRFKSAQTEDDWYQLYQDMPYQFYMSLFPRQLSVDDVVGANAPWERGDD